ncbi:3-oxoacyl-[acyl-carrier-protein] reductase [Clostridium amazonitimonense]|uniref:3-oxoacyl-[acyl-carrier-protein] reductase n=1 Tax=Clostridium amazonitimonense TaxID=1499689 RepID=UPI000509E8DF|nr:3-oxoacyl-[acyl-carrier-protein] reductase [Clostridium amazonitimonense]
MLKGKCAVVTGASRGIGRAIALKLASLGADLVINYRSEELEALEVLKYIESHGGNAILHKGDISRFESAKELMDLAYEKYNRVDILVNNAGITRDNLILRMKEEDFDKVIDVNLKGSFNCVKHVVPFMLKQKSGKIINMSSVVGVYGNTGQANYSASKAALIGLTKSLAKELGSRGINVNAVAPGFICTNMTDKLSEEVKAKLESSISLKRLGTVEDIAETVAFLSLPASDYITGQVIQVDGGMVI